MVHDKNADMEAALRVQRAESPPNKLNIVICYLKTE